MKIKNDYDALVEASFLAITAPDEFEYLITRNDSCGELLRLKT